MPKFISFLLNLARFVKKESKNGQILNFFVRVLKKNIFN